MGDCKESSIEERWKKKYTGKQHRNKSQDAARVLKENMMGREVKNRNIVVALYLRLISASHVGINTILMELQNSFKIPFSQLRANFN